MGPQLEAHILTYIIFLPLGAALGLAASSLLARSLFRAEGLPASVWRAVGMGASSLAFLLATIALAFADAGAGFRFAERVVWRPDFGVTYYVGGDGIGLTFVLLTTFLVPVVLLGCWHDVARSLRRHVFLILCLETALVGAFLSLDLLQLVLFQELALFLAFVLIGSWGGPLRALAAQRFATSWVIGSALVLYVLLVVCAMQLEQQGALDLSLTVPEAPGGGLGLLSRAIPAVDSGAPLLRDQRVLLGLFALGLAFKLPTVPLHGWLPRIHTDASAAAAALVSGTVVALSAFVLLRVGLPLFSEAIPDVAPVGRAAGAASVLYASLRMLAQRDLRRLVAYVTLAQLGFVVLGLFSETAVGLAGAVVALVANGLSTTGLVLATGFLATRRSDTRLAAFGGLGKPMPVLSTMLGLCGLASVFTPGLAGFAGAILVLFGVLPHAPLAAAVAAAGAALAAIALLRALRSALLGPLGTPENLGLMDLDPREKAAALAVVLPLFALGLHPAPVLSRLELPLAALVEETPAVVADEAARESMLAAERDEVELDGAELDRETGQAGDSPE